MSEVHFILEWPEAGGVHISAVCSRKYSAGAVILLSYMAVRILLDVRILAYPMGIDLLIFMK